MAIGFISITPHCTLTATQYPQKSHLACTLRNFIFGDDRSLTWELLQHEIRKMPLNSPMRSSTTTKPIFYLRDYLLHFSSIAVIFIRENIHRILNSLMDSQFTEKRKGKREIIRAPVSSCFISSSFNMVKSPVIIIKDSIGSTNIIFQLKQKTASGQRWKCSNAKMVSALHPNRKYKCAFIFMKFIFSTELLMQRELMSTKPSH